MQSIINKNGYQYYEYLVLHHVVFVAVCILIVFSSDLDSKTEVLSGRVKLILLLFSLEMLSVVCNSHLSGLAKLELVP